MRQIITENQEEHSTSQSTIAHNSTDIAPKESGNSTISQEQINRLLNSWKNDSQKNLVIDYSLQAQIREYLAYQESMASLLSDLARSIYSPFIVEIDSNKESITRACTIYKDKFSRKKLKMDILVFFTNGGYQAVPLSDIKLILVYLGLPYAPYIPENSSIYISCTSLIRSLGYRATYKFSLVHDTYILMIRKE